MIMTGVTETFLHELALCCTGLTELSISDVDVKQDSAYHLLQYCQQLQSVTLQRCVFSLSNEQLASLQE